MTNGKNSLAFLKDILSRAIYAGFGIFLLYSVHEKWYLGVILGTLEAVVIIFIFAKWLKRALPHADNPLVERLRLYYGLTSFVITLSLCGLPLLFIPGAVNVWNFGYAFVLSGIVSISNSLYVSFTFGKPLRYENSRSKLEALKLQHEELRLLANSVIWATLMFIIGTVVAGAIFWWQYVEPPVETLPILATSGGIQVAFFIIGIFFWIILPLFVEMGRIRVRVAGAKLD